MIEPISTIEEAPANEVRARIVAAASSLIAAGGRDAATTRAVATAAGVQAPTIYRLFGDKRGLLDAVAEHGLASYVGNKAALAPNPDPVQDLRDGWDMHVDFGLSNPGLFAIMTGDSHAQPRSPSVAAGLDVLRRRIRRVALAGRLAISEERALALLKSACNGTVLTLLRTPEHERDAGLSATAREAIIAAITGESIAPANPGTREAAIALRASLSELPMLTRGEKHLLEELLGRVAAGD
jgi:AcrR family transcriptional regulator